MICGILILIWILKVHLDLLGFKILAVFVIWIVLHRLYLWINNLEVKLLILRDKFKVKIIVY